MPINSGPKRCKRCYRDRKRRSNTQIIFCFIWITSFSILKALGIISEFGKISGYKINLTKSVLFPINDQESSNIKLLTTPLKRKLS
uniref:Uncharacterized protein n=1 Tax=Pygocentrus nattereri TaxID=42514 RepID=A0AAR2JU33_PYGNA